MIGGTLVLNAMELEIISRIRHNCLSLAMITGNVINLSKIASLITRYEDLRTFLKKRAGLHFAPNCQNNYYKYKCATQGCLIVALQLSTKRPSSRQGKRDGCTRINLRFYF